MGQVSHTARCPFSPFGTHSITVFNERFRIHVFPVFWAICAASSFFGSTKSRTSPSRPTTAMLPPKKKGRVTFPAKVARPVFNLAIKKGQITFSVKVACPVHDFAIKFSFYQSTIHMGICQALLTLGGVGRKRNFGHLKIDFMASPLMAKRECRAGCYQFSVIVLAGPSMGACASYVSASFVWGLMTAKVRRIASCETPYSLANCRRLAVPCRSASLHQTEEGNLWFVLRGSDTKTG